ncbi:uncharacterized protein LOC118187001 [Stegodyphus dumicola]|uniref:uncharacterized protein LOC118187001 n=1 Tax=Stegodyphus dumicola TaxID=202533 RepID=UPI0015A99E04|nr:uncharacterized protein LOC118187001 [Stegodyphus dumicola]
MGILVRGIFIKTPSTFRVENSNSRSMFRSELITIKRVLIYVENTAKPDFMDIWILPNSQSSVQHPNGRYEVALPWLAGHPAHYDKYDIAESRLRTVTKRLLNENNFEAYDAVFQQWELEGIIETVPMEHLFKLSHFLPHRPVIKPSSSTTKVRPVFDASFKRPGYASLNECLSVGPSLIHQIPPLLLRFRLGPLGVVADIKQAFLQIGLRAEDRDVLRFLWWEDAERTKLKIYRHCRVVFGITSSPFLLNAKIKYDLEMQKTFKIRLIN